MCSSIKDLKSLIINVQNPSVENENAQEYKYDIEIQNDLKDCKYMEELI